MQYKNLDIKTVDTFFEIFSNPKKFTEHMVEMRRVRDEILTALGMTDTKDKADRLLRQASDKAAAANQYDSKVRTECDKIAADLAEAVEKHESESLKDREWITTTKMKLSTNRGQFTRTSMALKKDLEERLEDVEKREEKVAAGKIALAAAKAEHEEYVKRVKAAV